LNKATTVQNIIATATWHPVFVPPLFNFFNAYWKKTDQPTYTK